METEDDDDNDSQQLVERLCWADQNGKYKGPNLPHPSNKSLLSVSEDIIGVGPRNILLDHHEGQKIDRKNIILGQNIDYGTCLNQEGNEAGVVQRATE